MEKIKKVFFAAIGLLAFGVPLACFTFVGCQSGQSGSMQSENRPSVNDVIMVAGRAVHTGAPVVLWTEAPYYNAYAVGPRFPDPKPKATTSASQPSVFPIPTPKAPDDELTYGSRRPRTPEIEKQLKDAGGHWTPELLGQQVDQFVIHYDVCGTSKVCFRVLHDDRKLSVHFLLDLDGTIYQTLDVTERAYHATVANDRSVGIEIAQIGAYQAGDFKPFAEWYHKDWLGRTRLTLPARFGDGALRTVPSPMAPARNGIIRGPINGQLYSQYDFTPQQYESLARLTAALNSVLPNVKIQYPRGTDGQPLARTLTAREFGDWHGLLGHFHVTDRKSDPGPAFDWPGVVARAKAIRSATPDREFVPTDTDLPSLLPLEMPAGEVTADEAKAGIKPADKAAARAKNTAAAKGSTTDKGSSKDTSGPNRK